MGIILLRHGESVANIAGDNSDTIETPLSPLGIKQALTTAKFLKDNFNIVAIMCSDYTRAIETAKPIADLLNIKIIIDKNLRESSNGVLDGVKFSDINKIPKIGNKLEQLIKKVSSYNLIDRIKNVDDYAKYRSKLLDLSEAETDDELFNRIRTFKKKAFSLEKTLKGDVLIVTHNGVIKYTMQEMFNIVADGLGNNFASNSDGVIKNCHISYVKKVDRKNILALQLYTGHLK